MKVASYPLVVLLLTFASPAPGSPVADVYQVSYDLEAAGDPSGALDALDKIPASGRQSYVFHLRRGWLLYSTGRNPESAAAYREAIERSPRAVEAKVGLLLPLMATRRWEDGLKTAHAVLAAAPGHPLAARRLAFCLFNLGRYGEAERRYRAIVEQYPADPEMWAGLGWALLRQRKLSDAKAAFETALAFAPRTTAALEGEKALASPGS